MTRIVDWAAAHARMVIAFVILSLTAGGFAYFNLPKEGEPDIEIPALFISVPFPGISASDSETLLVKPMETELAELDGLKTMTATAAEGYAGMALEFEFGWDKTKTIADVRDAMNKAEAKFPDGAEKYTINEINFSEFPIIVVALTGAVPERTMNRIANALQDRLEAMDAVLEAQLTGNRDEMVEVVIDPSRLEAYNVTAGELINVVRNNNLLIAAGEVEAPQGAFAVKIPSSFDEPADIYDLPVKVNGDRVVTLGDIAEIRLTFEDRESISRFNGTPAVALQVVKRKGYNLIETAEAVKAEVAEAQRDWPEPLKAAVTIGISNDQSRIVDSMISQLENSVLTAIALVMIVVLAALGPRAALLVGFAIPTSFLLCFVLLGLMGVAISNIVMFGLILAVGMLVDGAIVVVEYADKRIAEGTGPMHAYVEAAHRMFSPIVSSTATTLCAFLPMLFWPGVAGEFMSMLPTTLIFVLSASLVVALVYLPVIGGVAGRWSRLLSRASARLRAWVPIWPVRAALLVPAVWLMHAGILSVINPAWLTGAPLADGWAGRAPGVVLFAIGAIIASVTLGSIRILRKRRIVAGRRRTAFGWLIHKLVGNPVTPVLAIAGVIAFVVAVFSYYGTHNLGSEFFVDTETEQAIIYVRARGNLSLEQKAELVRRAEEIVIAHPGVDNAFAFAGSGNLNKNTGGATAPRDAIGQIQLEMIPWERRRDRPELNGDRVLEEIVAELRSLPGVQIDTLSLSRGPASGKPVHLRLKGEDWDSLVAATEIARDRFEGTVGLTRIEDTLPLPGIDWQVDVDTEKAGRFGADVATVGAMVQLVTRGLLLDTMRVPSSDEEIEIRVRLPEGERTLATLDTLRVRTTQGLVPLSNFVTRAPVRQLAEITRVDGKRFFDVKAGVAEGLVKFVDSATKAVLGYARRADEGEAAEITDAAGRNYRALVAPEGGALDVDAIRAGLGSGSVQVVPVNANERIAELTRWLESGPLPDDIAWEWTGDQEEQAESQAFLSKAFLGALGLMFIILLAQFNSLYHSILVLTAVVLSVAGVLIGMLVMNQPFSVIMTGTGIVALAGIVVNNNIVLIDTYQEYARHMPRLEAIARTAQDRLRPVMLTTITTMAGLAPMMLGLSLDFESGGYSINAPTSLWWKPLATAVVFGLGISTVLTLVFTPAMLSVPVWISAGAYASVRSIASMIPRIGWRVRRDRALARAARRSGPPLILWSDLPSEKAGPEEEPSDVPDLTEIPPPIRAAE